MDAPLRLRAPRGAAILMVVALLAMLVPAAAAAGPAPGGPPARGPGGTSGLTGPSNAAPTEIVLAYVRAHAHDFGLNARQVDDLYLHEELRLSTGATAIHLGQRVDGLRVRDAILTAVVAKDGRLLTVDGFLAGGRGSGKARLTAREALDVAADGQGAKAARRLTEADDTKGELRTFPNVYARGMQNATPVSTELVWFASDHGRSLRLAWRTDIEASGQSWYETVVDAESGTILDRRTRYADSGPQGTVFREQHPDATGASRQVTAFSGLDGTWVADRTTSGRNVNAYQDRNDDDANNEYQPQTPASGDPAYQHFDYGFTDAWRNTMDVTSTAALDADRDAIITQLFYYTNVMHDWLYGYGFDEASGNFQVDNFGRGGAGGDPVLAEAQDGWDFGCVDDKGTSDPKDDVAIRCLNNANFGTPADGSSPRMQMYMWAPSRPYRDGDLDGDVIAHEYGHGVSSRLVGGGNLGYANDHRGALGEGWSDVISYLKWGDAVVGEYVTGNATTGIRSVAYDSSNLTFQNYNPSSGSPHPNGEIWASALYDIRAQIPGGIPAMAQLVLDGMKATPANPSFLQARDALITADGGDNLCLIWSAFAGRGLGTASTVANIDAIPTASALVPPECRPTADAGGPYVTPEGTNKTLDGSASAAGSDPSAGSIVSWEWDLDNNGSFETTGVSPSFTTVGQDGVFTVGLRVTDAFGNTATDTATVTVTNVAPTVSINAITAIDELGTVTVSGVVSDPGWLDDLSATIDFDDGAGAVVLSGTEENGRPDATLTFSVNHQYGDNGIFSVEVCAADDDTTDNCDTEPATVANVDPTAVIDSSGEQVYDGVSAFILEAGQDLTVPAGSQDPGSDDLTFTWDWADGTTSVLTSLVNGPALDQPKSPTVQPRDVDLSATHAYGDACVYTLTVTVGDDDGGSASDTAAVLITGNADVSRGHGWWLNQYRAKSSNDFTAAELQCYLDIVGYLSLVFHEFDDASTRAKATKILNAPAKSPEAVIFDQHALGAWLNFANGSVKLPTPVDTDANGTLDSTFGAVMFTAETIRINPASTSAQIKAQKDIIERIALQSGG